MELRQSGGVHFRHMGTMGKPKAIGANPNERSPEQVGKRFSKAFLR